MECHFCREFGAGAGLGDATAVNLDEVADDFELWALICRLRIEHMGGGLDRARHAGTDSAVEMDMGESRPARLGLLLAQRREGDDFCVAPCCSDLFAEIVDMAVAHQIDAAAACRAGKCAQIASAF